jgi:hypothetical protein
MMTPTIHLNGTPADRLVEQYTDAFAKAQELLIALANIEFNARDYYINPDPNAFEQARQESSTRFVAVKTVRDEMQDFIVAIQDQQR